MMTTRRTSAIRAAIMLLVTITGIWYLANLLAEYQWNKTMTTTAARRLRIVDGHSKGLQRMLAEDATTAVVDIIGKRQWFDPFSERPFRTKSNEDRLQVYSIGPDRIDNKLFQTYDPTNGLFSEGDIVVISVFPSR